MIPQKMMPLKKMPPENGPPETGSDRRQLPYGPVGRSFPIFSLPLLSFVNTEMLVTRNGGGLPLGFPGGVGEGAIVRHGAPHVKTR